MHTGSYPAPAGSACVGCRNREAITRAVRDLLDLAQGREVPRQFSVIGFDDPELSRQWRPTLTTVHVPTEQMWTCAADDLLRRLDGSLNDGVQQEIEVDLVVRESSTPPAVR